MPSFSISLSGLSAESTALSVISNNLANLNTVGYKGESAVFSDMFYQQLGFNGAGNPIQVGGGSMVTAVASPFSQGNINSTGVSTDLAIQGDGFFVLNKGGVQLFTRAGDFSKNPDGYLASNDGSLVMGYAAANGVIDPSHQLSPLLLSTGQVYPASATTNASINLNLDASNPGPISAVGTLTMSAVPTDGDTVTIGGTTYTFKSSLSSPAVADEVLIGGDINSTLTNLKGAINAETTGGQAAGTTYSTGTMANTSASATTLVSGATSLNLQALTAGTDGNTVLTSTTGTSCSFSSPTLTGGAASVPWSTPLTVYDSLGTSHTLTFSFTKTSGGTWDYQITIPAADVGTTGAPQVVKTGTLQFDSTGKLVSPPTDIPGIAVSGLADGAQDLTFNWQLYDSTGASLVSQAAGASAASSTQQNGYAAGTMASFNISNDGIIHGVLTNGQTEILGQVALATFSNPQGLARNGENTFLAGLSSGLPNTGVAGTGGRGSLMGGSLESSNVDIATEFSSLIIAERGYQANAKAITTADDVTQATINLIQA
jgi:flagellar hook protein FlgE